MLVHMDGHVEYKGADDPAPEPTIARAAEVPGAEPVLDFDAIESPPALPVDLVPPPGTSASFMVPEDEPENEAGSDTPEVVEEPPQEEDHTVLAPPQDPTTFDFDTPPEYEEEEATPPPAVYNSAAPNSPDLSDVAAFGNSEMSGGRDGTLRYNLIIEGIDTVDVREAFREAITDRKFVWDIDQILRSVRNGRVQIHNVAPTKGYILISRLRGLPIKIRWEQYAIQQT